MLRSSLIGCLRDASMFHFLLLVRDLKGQYSRNLGFIAPLSKSSMFAPSLHNKIKVLNFFLSSFDSESDFVNDFTQSPCKKNFIRIG